MLWTGILLSLILAVSIIEAAKPVSIPDHLSGKWSGQQNITYRYKQSGSFIFVQAKKPVLLTILIQKDGSVNGSFGNAIFENAKVIKNRGVIGRWLHLATDFAIIGTLNGFISSEDSIPSKSISIPLVIEGTNISGSVFYRKGIDLFPMSGADLVKQN